MRPSRLRKGLRDVVVSNVEYEGSAGLWRYNKSDGGVAQARAIDKTLVDGITLYSRPMPSDPGLYA